MTDDRECGSPKRGVKGIREVSQLMERCDGYESASGPVLYPDSRRPRPLPSRALFPKKRCWNYQGMGGVRVTGGSVTVVSKAVSEV